MKVLLATVVYPTFYFHNFLTSLVNSIKNQTCQNFSTMFFLDNIHQSQVDQIISAILSKEKYFCIQNTDFIAPCHIRQTIINYAYEHNFDLLIFCDFDEILFPNKIKKTISLMHCNVDFSFCNTLLTDHNLKPIDQKSFFDHKDIPNKINNITPIISKNFIGLGDLTIKLKKTTLYKLTPKTLAYDWFIATHMLLEHWRGIQIKECLGSYRQHDHNYIGGNFILNPTKLTLGISVKKQHYKYFSNYDNRFKNMYSKILEVEEYVAKNENKYIKIVNKYFVPQKMCWWENIKTLEEIKQWI